MLQYTIIEPVRTRTIYNCLQYFSLEALGRELKECGFAMDGLYADVAGTPHDSRSTETAVVAAKPVIREGTER